VIRENLSNILSGINNAVQAIEATSTGGLLGDAATGTINTALAVTVKPAFNLTFNTALALVNVGSSFLGNLADASILGETTVTIPTTIQDPTYADLTNAGVDMTVPYEAGFIGTILKSDILSISIASNVDGYSPVFYAAEEVTAPYN
ncbi:adhesive domain-containing protein, partial [Enterococcus faecium]